MSLLEKTIEDTVVNWAKPRGFLTPKVKFVENGYPDRLFISPIGHTIFIEFKRENEKPRLLQDYRLEELRKRGIPAYWCDNAVEAINILKAAVEPARLPDASDSVTPFPSRSGSIFGSGIGQDVNMSSSSKDSILQGLGQALPSGSSAPAGVLSVAGGNKEVGGVRRLDVHDPARKGQGDISEIFRTDPPNKS